MNERVDFLETIGQALRLRQGSRESFSAFYGRIIYSAISDWLQTTIFTGERETSVVQVKRVGLEKTHMMQELFPEIVPLDAQVLLDYFYSTLLDNGVFLHRNFYVRPAPHRFIGNTCFSIVRGMQPEEIVSFSGLAPYVKQKAIFTNIAMAFGLPDIPLEKITEVVWKHSIPTTNDLHIDEYLNTNHSVGQPYYRSRPTMDDKMTMGRIRRENVLYDYYLVSNTKIRRISEQYINASYHEYARLYLMTQTKPQIVTATIDGKNLVYLDFSFHLPKPDLRFLRYIAWPSQENPLDNVWNFCMAYELWPIMKERLEFLKYKVVETYE